MKKTKTAETEASKRSVRQQTFVQRLRDARMPLTVCGLALAVYPRSLFCGFVRDDFQQIVNNRQVQSWEYLPQLLGSHLWSQVREQPVHFYRPLFSVWMLLVYSIGGAAPWFWHLSSIMLHVVATYLVFRLCRHLTGNEIAAAAGAVLFAVHPIHVDAVTWVSASCEVLFTIFTLAAMLVLLRDQNGNDQDPAPRVVLSALWFGVALAAKETGFVMLAILPLIAWTRLKGQAAGTQRFWRSSWPYGAVAALYLIIRWAVLHGVGAEIGDHSWAQVIFSAPSILIFYLKKLFLPWGLSGSYVNPLTVAPTAMFWLQLTIIAIGAAAIARFAYRWRSLLGLAVALIVIPILPALAVIRIYEQGDMTHDRYLYLPSVGLSLLIAVLVKKNWALEKPAKVSTIAAVTIVLAVFSAEAIFQQKFYQDDVTFYSRVIEVSPSDAYAMGMLGNVYLDQRLNDLALAQFQRANQIEPQDRTVTMFLARGLFVEGRYQEAEILLKNLLQTQTQSPAQKESTLLSLANIEIGLGNLDYARELLKQAGQIDDKFPQLHWTWGALYQKQNMLPQALAEYEKEFEITGDELAQKRSEIIERRIQAQSPGQSSIANRPR
jgi:protein O-mannosyl-transferase